MMNLSLFVGFDAALIPSGNWDNLVNITKKLNLKESLHFDLYGYGLWVCNVIEVLTALQYQLAFQNKTTVNRTSSHRPRWRRTRQQNVSPLRLPRERIRRTIHFSF